MKKQITTEKNQRLDKILVNEFPNLSRNQIEHLIKKYGVVINNKKIYKPAYKLEEGENVFVDWDLSIEKLKPNQNIKLDILFENSDFIVINKPAGLSVHPLRVSDTNTLVNSLIAYDKNIANIGEDLLRPGIVHRLDKETSGIMIVAKNNSSFNKFKEMFQNHLVQKTYIALVYGKMKNIQGEINFSITRSKQKFNKRKIDLKKEDGSVEAITMYRVIEEFKNTSLLEVYPKTGRTHQIRVHLAALSNFIIGDKEYGSSKINKEFPLKRQFLHAKRLEFEWGGKKMVFEADLPGDLQKCLDYVNL